MLGSDAALKDPNHEMGGVVPRACKRLFEAKDASQRVTCSYLEVYNDRIFDMLAANPREEKKLQGGEVKGLVQRPIATVADVMTTIAHGQEHRIVAPMKMNPRSSRGHGLIVVEMEGACLTFVDLAGAESAKKSTAKDPNPQRSLEAASINRSLSALKRVIDNFVQSQAKGGKLVAIPFRESKLTQLLQSSLEGNGQVAFVITVRSEEENASEARETLSIAERALTIKGTVTAETADGGHSIKGLRRKVEELESHRLRLQGELRNAWDDGERAREAEKLKEELEVERARLREAEKQHSATEKQQNTMLMQLHRSYTSLKSQMFPSDQTWLPRLPEWTEYECARIQRELREHCFNASGVDALIDKGFELKHHLFLSHCWKTAQDKVNTLRRRLGTLLPTANIFLDVPTPPDRSHRPRTALRPQCSQLFRGSAADADHC
jgi:hypothetical protein